jgi:hypothetical protein
MRLGILHQRIRPGCPQENGRTSGCIARSSGRPFSRGDAPLPRNSATSTPSRTSSTPSGRMNAWGKRPPPPSIARPHARIRTACRHSSIRRTASSRRSRPAGRSAFTPGSCTAPMRWSINTSAWKNRRRGLGDSLQRLSAGHVRGTGLHHHRLTDVLTMSPDTLSAISPAVHGLVEIRPEEASCPEYYPHDILLSATATLDSGLETRRG